MDYIRVTKVNLEEEHMKIAFPNLDLIVIAHSG